MSLVMAVITTLGFKRLKLSFLLASCCKSDVSWSMRSIKAHWFNVLEFSNFWDIRIYFKTFKRPWLSQNNSRVIRKSVTWKSLQGSGTYFFQQWRITWKKEKKKPPTEEVGLSSFLSSGYCTFLCTLKCCQINVFPTERQAFTGNSCVCMKIILTIFCL